MNKSDNQVSESNDGYRSIGEKDVRQKGDQWRSKGSNDNWRPTTTFKIITSENAARQEYRRPIEPTEDGTTEHCPKCFLSQCCCPTEGDTDKPMDETVLEPHPLVKGQCPSCGGSTLFLGTGGYVTCSVIGCSDPGKASDVLDATEKPTRGRVEQGMIDLGKESKDNWLAIRAARAEIHQVVTRTIKLEEHHKELNRRIATLDGFQQKLVGDFLKLEANQNEWEQNLVARVEAVEKHDQRVADLWSRVNAINLIIDKIETRITKLETGGKSQLRAMVLEYQPDLTHSVWIDFFAEDENGKAVTRSELIEFLKMGVRNGDYVAWRLVRIEKEVIGNVDEPDEPYTSEMAGSGQRGTCGKCKKGPTPEGHDGCLGTLPGPIMNACCGHGNDEMAYIQYTNGSRIAGEDAIAEQQRLIADDYDGDGRASNPATKGEPVYGPARNTDELSDEERQAAVDKLKADTVSFMAKEKADEPKDDFVGWLRRSAGHATSFRHKAADRIEQQAAEIEKLQEEVDAWRSGRAHIMDTNPLRIAISPKFNEGLGEIK